MKCIFAYNGLDSISIFSRNNIDSNSLHSHIFINNIRFKSIERYVDIDRRSRAKSIDSCSSSYSKSFY